MQIASQSTMFVKNMEQDLSMGPRLIIYDVAFPGRFHVYVNIL